MKWDDCKVVRFAGGKLKPGPGIAGVVVNNPLCWFLLNYDEQGDTFYMSTPSSSSSSVNSPSSSLEDSLKIDLTLDDMSFTDGRSDPLEFLLQSISTSPDSTDSSSSSSSSQANSPPEWPQMPAWPQDTKLGDMNSDFDFSFPMDLDFNSNPAVDPSSLHFNTSMFSQQSTAIVPDNEFLMTSNALADEVLAGSMFSFDSPVNPWTPQPAPVFNRRLSITSSSSSSGASLSPVIEHRPPVSTSSVSSGSSDNGHVENDPAFELAQRVRQVAGVTLAVPVSAQVQQMAAAGESQSSLNSLARFLTCIFRRSSQATHSSSSPIQCHSCTHKACDYQTSSLSRAQL